MAHILLVDDSPSILHMVKQWLTTAGHRVTSLNSGLHFERLLRTTQFDLVITDIYMPDVDGLQVLSFLRTERPKLPCIAMSSAEGDLNFLGAAKQLGAVATLHKPFTQDALRAAVEAILESNTPSTSASKISA